MFWGVQLNISCPSDKCFCSLDRFIKKERIYIYLSLIAWGGGGGLLRIGRFLSSPSVSETFEYVVIYIDFTVIMLQGN